MSSNICRICGTQFNLMHVLQGGEELLEKLRVCANIKIDFEGDLPKHICLKCEQGISFSYRLRKQGEAMEQKLRQNQKNNAIDLSNEVDDIEDELQEFRVQNAKNKNGTREQEDDDDVEIIECLENKKDFNKAHTDNINAQVQEIAKKPNWRNYLDELKAKSVINKQKQAIQIVDEGVRDVTTVEQNVAITDANFNRDTEQPLVDQADVIEKFIPMEMTNTTAQLQTVDAEVEQENKEHDCVDVNSNTNAVILVDDDVEIIDDYQPWVENPTTTTTNTNIHLETYQPEECVQQLEEYTENAFDTANLTTPQNQTEPIEYIQEAECDNGGNIVEIIKEFNNTIQQIDAAIIGQDNLENDIIESGFQVVPENVNNSLQNEIVLEQNIGFQTLEKYSIDLVDKVEVVSEVEYDNAEDAEYVAYAEDEDDVAYVDNADDADYVPGRNNTQSAMLKLQSHGQLKVSLIYKCDTCSESFHNQTSYRMHIKQHGRERFNCIQCSKWFPTRYRLRQHERTHDDDIDLYVCSLCANRYRHPQNLKRHMRSAHSTEDYNPNQCGLCHEVFTRPDVLKNHMITHIDQRTFPCDLCEKTFKSMFYLMAHKRIHLPKTNTSQRRLMNSSHNTPTYTSTDSSSSPQHNATTQRVYTCAYCGKISKHNFAHKNHLRTHTLERPYDCEFCAKKFRTLAAKITHERIHNDVRPYQCERCLLSFRQPSHLKEHKLIHDGVMAFVCSVCNIAFTKKSNLKVHMRIHTGERPYKCAESECGEQFAKLSQLKRHAAQAHARDVEVLEGEDDEENEEDDEEDVNVSEDDGDLLNTAEEELLGLNVSIGAEETAMDMLLENNTQYNSLYILDDMNSS